MFRAHYPSPIQRDSIAMLLTILALQYRLTYCSATEESSLVEPWAACYVNDEEPSAASSSFHSVLHEPVVVDPSLVPGAQQGDQFDWDTLYWVLAGLAGLSGVAVAVCFFRPRCKRSQPVSMDNADVELQMMEELDDGKFD